MNEYTTRKGLTISVGDVFRDRRDSNTRWLRVDRIEPENDTARAYLTVIRQEYDGAVTEPMRQTDTAIERLASRDFLPVPGVNR